ncbi:hypothetical protein BH09ACT8_BH09ACT8_46350 [soil metagenome]
MPTFSTAEMAPCVIVVLASAALITFLVLFVVSRRQLSGARRELEQLRR